MYTRIKDAKLRSLNARNSIGKHFSSETLPVAGTFCYLIFHRIVVTTDESPIFFLFRLLHSFTHTLVAQFLVLPFVGIFLAVTLAASSGSIRK